MSTLAVILAVVAVATGQRYTSRYDGFDVEEVLKSERLLKNYVNCLMDRGPCTPEGRELKRNLAEAFETGCSKCTEAQKEKSRKAIDFLRKNKKEMWAEVERKYDPEHAYRGTR